VVIDHAGGCVRQQCRVRGLAERDQSIFLNAFADDCRRLIAVPHRCVVWVTQQLAGRVNGQGLQARLAASDAAEGKRFTSGTDACLALSPADRRSGRVRRACVRGEAEGREVLLVPDGNFGGFVEL
jgi:hypothetical protein